MNTAHTVGDVVRFLDRFAPSRTAADWDNVGLLIGDNGSPCSKVMTCLTLTEDVAAEAIRENCQLIISHHPVLFKPVKSLTMNSNDGKLLLPLIQAKVAVYSPHTAFDNCPGGINDGLAQKLGLTEVTSLRTEQQSGTFKLTVFVPENDLAKVSDAMFTAGAGRIGINDRYKECSFQVKGTGTFFGGDESNPVVGQKGRREYVDEVRLETVVPQAKLSAVVAAMRRAHSYEEPAFDMYPVTVFPYWGQGRVGILNQPMRFKELAEHTKTILRANTMQTVGKRDKLIRKVAIACGAAGEFLRDAVKANADCFLTGELRFHDALTARAQDIAIMLPGHYATERPGIEDLAERIKKEFPQAEVWPSRVETDPLENTAR